MKKFNIVPLITLTLSIFSHAIYAENLLGVYQQAIKYDPLTLEMKAKYEANQEIIDQARSALLPHVAAVASVNNNQADVFNTVKDIAPLGSTISSSTQTSSYGAKFTMELYHHDAWQRMSNAKKIAHLSDLNYQLAKQELILRVTHAYFEVLRANDNLEFSIAEKATIKRQLQQTKKRFSIGTIAITDVEEAQAKFDIADTAEIRARNNVYNAKENLRTITNIYPNNLSILNVDSFSTTTPLPANIDSWQQIAENKSLSIIIQKVSSDIAKENINIAQAGHLPTLDLNGQIGRSKSDFTRSRFSFDNIYLNNHSLGLTLTVPIYSGGKTSSLVRQAQKNYIAAAQSLERVHRNVVRNIRDAYHNVNTSISAIKSLQQALVSTKTALKATETGFKVGTRTIVDVLNSTKNLYDAKRNLSSTRYNYIESVLALKQASGTISELDIKEINQGLQIAK